MSHTGEKPEYTADFHFSKIRLFKDLQQLKEKTRVSGLFRILQIWHFGLKNSVFSLVALRIEMGSTPWFRCVIRGKHLFFLWFLTPRFLRCGRTSHHEDVHFSWNFGQISLGLGPSQLSQGILSHLLIPPDIFQSGLDPVTSPGNTVTTEALSLCWRGLFPS